MNDQEQLQLERVVRAGRPAVFERVWGDVAQWQSMRRWASFEYLARRMGPAQLVDVACSADGVFSGDSHARQTARLPFAQVAALGASLRDDTPHFARDQGVRYYLCQCPLEALSLCEDLHDCLPGLLQQLLLRQQQQQQHQQQQQQQQQQQRERRRGGGGGGGGGCSGDEHDGDGAGAGEAGAAQPSKLSPNLWLSLERSRSNIHYDGNHGVLCVLGGSKRVRLWPPGAALELQARSVCSDAPHHSRCALDGSATAAGACAGGLSLTICPNQALFIPEGWWHCVDSEPGTVAINVWFAGEPLCSCCRPIP